MKKILVALGMAVALAVAAPATADNESFLRALEAQGVPSTGNGVLASGYLMCSRLQNGASREIVLSEFEFFSEQILDAAQQELCPDTL